MTKAYYLVSAISTTVVLDDGRPYPTNRRLYFSSKAHAAEVAEKLALAIGCSVTAQTPGQAGK